MIKIKCLKLLFPFMFILMISVSSCKDDCRQSDFTKRFFDCIKVMEVYSNSRSIDFECFYEASIYVSAVSGIEGNINFGEITTYPKADFEKDKLKWHNWYNEFGCQMTLEKASNFDRQYKTKLKDYYSKEEIQKQNYQKIE